MCYLSLRPVHLFCTSSDGSVALPNQFNPLRKCKEVLQNQCCEMSGSFSGRFQLFGFQMVVNAKNPINICRLRVLYERRWQFVFAPESADFLSKSKAACPFGRVDKVLEREIQRLPVAEGRLAPTSFAKCCVTITKSSCDSPVEVIGSVEPLNIWETTLKSDLPSRNAISNEISAAPTDLRAAFLIRFKKCFGGDGLKEKRRYTRANVTFRRHPVVGPDRVSVVSRILDFSKICASEVRPLFTTKGTFDEYFSHAEAPKINWRGKFALGIWNERIARIRKHEPGKPRRFRGGSSCRDLLLENAASGVARRAFGVTTYRANDPLSTRRTAA